MAFPGEIRASLLPVPQRQMRPASIAETLIRQGREPFITVWESTNREQPNGKAGILFPAEGEQAATTIKVTAEEGIRLHHLRTELLAQKSDSLKPRSS